MAEQPTSSTPSPEPAPAARPHRKRPRWGRRIGIGVGVVVLLLVVLVVFLPTLASTGWARSIILGKVNQRLNGAVAVEDWSLGWTSPITARGVSVKDAAGKEILAIATLDTELTLLEAVRQHFDVGRVVIDGLKADIVRRADGTMSLDELVKKDQGAPEAPAADEGPTTLPDVSGSLVIQNSTVTLRDESLNKSAAFDLAGELTIPDINQPITHDLKLTARLEGAAPGTLTLIGQADIAENNVLQVDLEQLRQKLSLEGLDLSALALLIPAEAGVEQLAGIFSGQLDVQGAAGALRLSAGLQGRDAALSIPAFEGDTYQAETLSITLPPTLVKLGADAQPIHVLIGDGAQQRALKIQLPEALVQVRADAPVAALQRLGEGLAPGAAGELGLDADVDLGALARQLPRMMQVRKELRDLRGRLTLDARLALQETEARPALTLNITDVAARNVQTGAEVRLEPIQLSASARHLGGGGAIPDLRDISLRLASGFAAADVTGANLGSVSGSIRGTLDRLQQELGQFADYGLSLAGSFDIALKASGELTRPGGTASASATVNLSDLTIEGMRDVPPIRRQRVQLGIGGRLRRGGEGGPFVQAIEKVNVNLAAGPAQRPWLAMDLVSDEVELPGHPAADPRRIPLKVVRYDLRKLDVDLAAAQEHVALLEQELEERGVDITRGTISLTSAGSLDRDVLTLTSLNLAMRDIVAAQEKRTFLDRLTTTLDLAGRVELGSQATTINLSRLHLAEPHNYITLRKTSGGELSIVLPDAGGFAGRGQVQIGLSLEWANDILRAFQKQVVARDAAGQVRRGYLEAQVDLAQDRAAAPTRIALDAAIRNLVVTAVGGKSLEIGDVNLAADGTMAQDQSELALASVDLRSALATAAVRGVRVDLKTDNPLRTLRSAEATLDVPDAGRAWGVYEAFVPPAAAPAAASGEAELPPLRITGGKLQVQARIGERNGRTAVMLQRLAGDGVALARGRASHVLSPFELSLSAELLGDAAGTLQQVLIEQLEGNFGFAQFKATQPVRVVDLGGADPEIDGTIEGRGDLERVLTLVNLLGASAERAAYSGAFDFVQKVVTDDGRIALDGSLNVRQLKPTDPDAAPINDDLQLANSIRIDPQAESLTIQRLNLAMPRTQSLVVMVEGGVQRYTTQRDVDLKAFIKTDWERLWQLVHPLLDESTRQELADARFFGIEQRNWTIRGSYPADKPFHEAIRGLTAAGGIGIKSAQAMGFDVRDLDVPFELADGRLKLLFARQEKDQPYRPNATVNGGALNLLNVVLDFTHADGLRISAPENHKLIVRMSMNPVLADRIYGRFINPVFADAQQASGLIDVVIVKCDGFPVADLLGATETSAAAQPRQADRGLDAFEQWRRSRQGGAPDAAAQSAMASVERAPGRLDVRYSISDVQLGAPLLERAFQIKRVNMAITEGRFQVANGVIRTQVPMMINDNLMLIDGALRPDSLQILNMVAAVPVGLLPEKWRQSLPKNLKLQVPMSGTMDNFTFDIAGAIKQNLLSGENLGGVLEDLIRGGDRKQTQPAPPAPQPAQPRQGGSIQPREGAPPRHEQSAEPRQSPPSEQAQPKPDDPLGGLLDLLTREPREREQRRQQEPDQRSR